MNTITVSDLKKRIRIDRAFSKHVFHCEDIPCKNCIFDLHNACGGYNYHVDFKKVLDTDFGKRKKVSIIDLKDHILQGDYFDYLRNTNKSKT